MNCRNLIFEWICDCAKLIVSLPIVSVVIIFGINVYMMFPTQQSVICETETVTEEREEYQETLYIEETHLSDTELPLYEISQEQPSSGYLVTEEMAMVAHLVQAEAGNQDLTGKRLVADVALNRVDSEKYPNTIEEVIFQKDPVQFGVTVDGAFEKAKQDVTEECFEAVHMEWERDSRIDKEVLYFGRGYGKRKNPFKHGDHWFSY